jgi:uncharacterized protein (DUF885 family)
MVVDPGIHVFGWTREQAVSYMMAGAIGTKEDAERMVDRIAVWPAQLTYDTGGLEFASLQEHARTELGSKRPT